MKRSATVIIGSNFGDEGKGLLTDFYAAQAGGECIVARFNGGAQAGHTVVLPDGTRHVHSHFASGTLGGAATYLDQNFVSNPLLFFKERDELMRKIAAPPVVFADERGLVTTPFDMLVNQFAEQARGSGKHGSCGVGFGETVERSLHERFVVRVGDLNDSIKLSEILNAIRREWIPRRLRELKIERLSDEQAELLNSAGLTENFLQAAEQLISAIKLAPATILKNFKSIIFEGAQGLLLDQDSHYFPHVTRSKTGLTNAVTLANNAGIDALEVVYATRAYVTRHGAGFLPHELAAAPYSNIVDLTNVPNPHQDALRFGWLDIDSLAATIHADLRQNAAASKIKIAPQLAVTCLDQLDETAFFVIGGEVRQANSPELIVALNRATRLNRVLTSWGETRRTIVERNF